MKIVHVLPALTKGGGERVALDLANAAVADGHEVAMLLAYPVDPALLQHRLDPRVELRFICPKPSRFWPYLALPVWLRRHWMWIATRDIIHCHLTFGTVVGTMIQATRNRIGRKGPVVVETYHAVGMNIPGWKRRWDHARLMRRDAVALVAEDAFWSSFRKRYGPDRFRFIPNGVSENPAPLQAEVNQYRMSVGIPEGALVIGSVGRLVAERRPDKLLHAFLTLGAERPDIHFLFAGEGGARERLHSLATDRGLARQVHFPGLARDATLPLALIDIYWTVNVGSTTGIAALEASRQGLPVLAVQLDEDYRPAKSDWIPTSADPRSLANTTMPLLDDARARSSLALAQREHVVTDFSVAAMASRYADFYATAMSNAFAPNPRDQDAH